MRPRIRAPLLRTLMCQRGRWGRVTSPAAPPKSFRAECPKCDKVGVHEEFSRSKTAKWGHSGPPPAGGEPPAPNLDVGRFWSKSRRVALGSVFS